MSINEHIPGGGGKTPNYLIAALAVFCTAAAFSPALATTYYKVGSDESKTSSFSGNVDNKHGWSTIQGATTTSTVSDFANSDFIIGPGLAMRTPETDANIEFGGKSLTLKGTLDSLGAIALKKSTNKGERELTFKSLIVDGAGRITISQANSHFIFKGAMTLKDNSTLIVNCGGSSQAQPRTLTIDSTLTGGETATILVQDSVNGAYGALTLTDAGAFYGTIAGEDSANNFSLVVKGGFNGTITSLPATTQSVKFNYDGLPAGKGLCVKTTDIPAALKTKLLFYSQTKDFTAGGIPLLTFPEGTTVNPAEFTIKYATTYDGTGTAIKLQAEPVVNEDGTITLVSKIGNTYYKIGNDKKDASSFLDNIDSTVGWALTSDATATTTISEGDWAAGTFIVGSGGDHLLRTPAGVKDVTFHGRVLRLEGHGDNGVGMSLKGGNDSTVTIPKLVSQDGRISAGDANSSYTLKGEIDIVRGFGLYLCAHDTGTRTIYVDSSIKGGATTKLVFSKHSTSEETGTQVFHINNAADFLGEATVTADSVCTTKLYINGAFGGSVGALGNTLSTLVVNYDGLPADKGLRCTTTSIPDKLKTTLTFYSSDTAKFKKNKFPLVTFPAGTEVDPSQFTIKYAETWNGAAKTIPYLTTYTEDDSVVLAVNAPVSAKWDAASGKWKFYDGDNADLTEKCGLSAPDSTITVLIDSTEAAVHAAGVPAKGFQLAASLDLTGATDLSALNNLTIQDNYSIDLKGYNLTLTIGEAFFAKAGTITDSTGNGKLHVNVAEGDVVHNELVALTGGLKFVKEGAGRFCSKRSQAYTGGNEIVNGVFGPEPGDASPVGSGDCSYNADVHPLGASGSQILVQADGTFDIGGNYGYGEYAVVLNGGKIMSSRADGSFVHQNDTTANGLGAFSLTDDSTLYLSSDMVVNGWNENPVSLGGNKLYIDANFGNKKLYWSKDVANGTLRFGAADEKDSVLVIDRRDVDAKTVDFIDEGGIVLNKNFSVRDYTAARAYANTESGGSADLFVYGTFKPQTDYFWGCKMMDGSTIDLSGKTAAWSLTSAEKKGDGKKNVEFADNATVTVKLGERSVQSRMKIITWDAGSRPENLGTLKFASAEGERKRSFVKKDDGLYVVSGFTLSVH